MDHLKQARQWLKTLASLPFPSAEWAKAALEALDEAAVEKERRIAAEARAEALKQALESRC